LAQLLHARVSSRILFAWGAGGMMLRSSFTDGVTSSEVLPFRIGDWSHVPRTGASRASTPPGTKPTRNTATTVCRFGLP